MLSNRNIQICCVLLFLILPGCSSKNYAENIRADRGSSNLPEWAEDGWTSDDSQKISRVKCARIFHKNFDSAEKVAIVKVKGEIASLQKAYFRDWADIAAVDGSHVDIETRRSRLEQTFTGYGFGVEITKSTIRQQGDNLEFCVLGVFDPARMNILGDGYKSYADIYSSGERVLAEQEEVKGVYEDSEKAFGREELRKKKP